MVCVAWLAPADHRTQVEELEAAKALLRRAHEEAVAAHRLEVAAQQRAQAVVS
jgi:hypothetical protein